MPEPKEGKAVSKTTTIRIDKSTSVEVRDGTVLKADVYRPDDGQKHPAILMRTPYHRQMALDMSFLPVYEAAAAGYAVVIESQRGTSDSGGKDGLGDILLTIEGPDGYDSVEWLANQSWCDGSVGTAGGSYMGLNQWITAKENPPHLKAMAPWISGSGGTEPSRANGIVNLGVALNWIIRMAVEITDRQETLGKDVSHIRKLLNQAVIDPSQVYDYLPLKDVPHFNFEGIREIWTSRILNTSQDTPEYFKKTRTPYEKVQVPCFHVSGWYDFYPSGTFSHFQNMQQQGGSQLVAKINIY
jgi:putative CocE/NonD family hydrolase